MLINELFNTKTEIRVTGNTPDVVTMDFNIGDMEFMFVGSNDTWEEDSHESWNIEFGLRRDDMIEYELTQTGNAYQVLAAVQQCVNKMLAMHPAIGQIVFTADKSEASRVKLYDRLLRALKVPGWNSRKEVGGGRDFYIFFKT